MAYNLLSACFYEELPDLVFIRLVVWIIQIMKGHHEDGLGEFIFWHGMFDSSVEK